MHRSHNRRRGRIICAAALAFSAQQLAGCATVTHSARGHLDAYSANDYRLDEARVADFVESQNAILDALAAIAPPAVNAEGATDYVDTVAAGLHYVDVRCQGYLLAVFWFARSRDASSQQTQLLGSSAAAAMEILDASRQLIGLTPLAFTLLDDTINNLGNSLLFSLPPEVVSELVHERQQAYRAGLASSYTSRAAALSAIQGYAELCLAPNIEAAAVQAVSAQRFQPRDPSPPEPVDQEDGVVEGVTDEATTPEPVPARIPPNTRPIVDQVEG